MSSYDGMAEGTLRLILGHRQVGVGDKGHDRLPVLENFVGQRLKLRMLARRGQQGNRL
jgi:hypothetical protein